MLTGLNHKTMLKACECRCGGIVVRIGDLIGDLGGAIWVLNANTVKMTLGYSNLNFALTTLFYCLLYFA